MKRFILHIILTLFLALGFGDNLFSREVVFDATSDREEYELTKGSVRIGASQLGLDISSEGWITRYSTYLVRSGSSLTFEVLSDDEIITKIKIEYDGGGSSTIQCNKTKGEWKPSSRVLITKITVTLQNLITDLYELKDGTKYLIHTKKEARGSLGVANGELASTNPKAQAHKCEEAMPFAIYKFKGKYFLYSVTDHKFITKTGGETDIPQLDDLWTLTKNANGYFMFNIANNYLNVNNVQGIQINSRGEEETQWDDGNQFTIQQVGELKYSDNNYYNLYGYLSPIDFEDDEDVITICVAKWDIDGDGELSKIEAASVTDLENVFRNTDITSFDELQYFTGLTRIDESAFSGCSRLKFVSIPKNVTSIGNHAFSGCEKLHGVYCYAEQVPNVDESSFAGFNMSNADLYVPAIAYDAYRATAPWSNFGYIDAIDPIYATRIYFNQNSLLLTYEGQTIQLNAIIVPENATYKDVTWESSNEGVAIVDENGNVTAVGNGTATITATNTEDEDLSASCTVYVKIVYATDIYLNQSELPLTSEGETVQLNAIIVPENATYKRVAWTSSDENVATVDENGYVTAIGNGTTIITATTQDGTNLTASCTVSVNIDYNVYPVTNISLNHSEFTMTYEGKIMQLNAIIEPENATNKDVTWESSNEGVAIVDENGLVTAIDKGVATITATTQDGNKTASCTVTVKMPAFIHFADATVKDICVAQWDTNHDGELSKKEAAAVKDLGNDFQTTKITSFNELQYFTGLTSIDYNTFYGCRSLTSVTIPESVTIIGTSAFSDCSSLTSVTLPASVATIEDYAFVDCSSLTTVTIPKSVTYIDQRIFKGCNNLHDVYCLSEQIPDTHKEVFYNCYLILQEATLHVPSDYLDIYKKATPWKDYFGEIVGIKYATNINLNESEFTMTSLGSTKQLNAIITPTDAANKRVTWSSSNTAIATVSSTGLVTATGNGTATITATANDGSGVTATCKVINRISELSDLRQLSNTKQYLIHTRNIARGSLGVANGELASTNPNAQGHYCKKPTPFAILYQGGKYYLYSINDHRFFRCTGAEGESVLDRDLDAITLTMNKYGYYRISFGSNYLNVNNNPGIIINTYGGPESEWDDGNQFIIEEVGDFDPTGVFDNITLYRSVGKNSFWDNKQYAITTEWNGKRYFLDKQGYLTENATTDCLHTFSSKSLSQGYAPVGWQLDAMFTNPKLTLENQGSIARQGHLLTSTQGRLDWEAQVWLQGENGKYAVRSTNATGTEWGANTYWAVMDNNGDNLPEADYSLQEAFVWELQSFRSVESIKMEPSTATMTQASESRQLTVNILPDNATNKSLTWNSSDESVATVDDYGNVTATGNGTATITATTTDGTNLSASCTVYVFEGSIIDFADANVKAICIANWDTNSDGELSEGEAAAVTDLGDFFNRNNEITSFDELQFFTGLTSIGNSAFYGCNCLTSIVIPNSVTNISNLAFSNCGLTSITIPESIITVDMWAFSNCFNLTSVTIPNNVTSISYGVFSGCNNLTSIVVEEGNTRYDSRDNCNAIIETATNTLIAGCKNTVIPESVTSIDNYAFRVCIYLTSIVIPESVTSIGDGAFDYCGSLRDVYCYAEQVPYTKDGNAFENSSIESATLHVPAASLDAYMATWPWSEFGNFVSIDDIDNTVDVTNIYLNTNQLNFSSEGEVQQLYTTIEPNNATNQGVTWTSSDESVATVDDYGYVTAMGNGTTVITATTEDGSYSDTCYVTVAFSVIIPGDVNGDNDVDVADIVAEIDYVLGAMAGNVDMKGDVNGDRAVDVADIVAVIDYVLEAMQQQNHAPAYAHRKSLENIYEEGNELTATTTPEGIRLSLCGSVPYTAFQFLLTLPGGVHLEEVIPDAFRTKHHSLMFREISIDRYLVLGYAQDNRTIRGTEGTLLDMLIANSLSGVADLSDIRFVTAKGERHRLQGLTVDLTTGLEEMNKEKLKENHGKWYDLSGRRVNNAALHRGIYLNNGKKVVKK